jgi:hypothetical protein
VDLPTFLEQLARIERTWAHTLKDWELGDLKLLRRTAIKRGRALPSDVHLLKYFGLPMHGYVLKHWPPRRKSKPTATQGSLF